MPTYPDVTANELEWTLSHKLHTQLSNHNIWLYSYLLKTLNFKSQTHVHYPLIPLPHPRSRLQLNKAGSKRACSDVYMRTTGVHLARREESRVLRALEREERARRCRLRALCVGFCTTSCSHNPPSFTKSMVLKCVKTRHCNRLLSRVVANFNLKPSTGYTFSSFLE